MTDTDDTARLRALLEGLEHQEVEHFMQNASIEDAMKLGKAIAEDVKETDEDVKELSRIIRVIRVLTKTDGVR